MQALNIGDAAHAAGVTPKMIRHYEALGLIPSPPRTDAGYRLYGEREVGMLRFIRQSRSLGFSIQQIEGLLALWRDPARQSREVKQVALDHLDELRRRQQELEAMRGTLEELVAQCPGDQGAHCAILDKLAQGGGADVPRAIATRTLKQVRPGERRARNRPTLSPKPALPPAHAALSAWTRALAPAPLRG